MRDERNTLHLFKKHIAVFLLLLSTFFVVPKELLHELSFHNDTVDSHCHATEGSAVSTIHHHCDILQAFLPPYNETHKSVDFSTAVKIISRCTFNIPSFSVDVDQRFVIRGPPAAIVSC